MFPYRRPAIINSILSPYGQAPAPPSRTVAYNYAFPLAHAVTAAQLYSALPAFMNPNTYILEGHHAKRKISEQETKDAGEPKRYRGAPVEKVSPAPPVVAEKTQEDMTTPVVKTEKIEQEAEIKPEAEIKQEAEIEQEAEIKPAKIRNDVIAQIRSRRSVFGSEEEDEEDEEEEPIVPRYIPTPPVALKSPVPPPSSNTGGILMVLKERLDDEDDEYDYDKPVKEEPAEESEFDD